LAFTKKESPSRRHVAGHISSSGLPIQRVHEHGKSIEFAGWEVERRHACSWNPIADDVAQLLNRPAAHPGVPGKTWCLVCATGVGAVAPDAAFRVYFLAFRRGYREILTQ
jgi:hypothetical protein